MSGARLVSMTLAIRKRLIIAYGQKEVVREGWSLCWRVLCDSVSSFAVLPYYIRVFVERGERMKKKKII